MIHGSDHLVIPYEATDFPLTSSLNGAGSLAVTWDEVLWAAVTVGKAQWDLGRHGHHSVAEILHRVACMTAYFDVDGDGRIAQSPAFTQLDPSEKAVVSFYSGMTFAKLYADKVLDVPWMMHISRYESSWSVRYGANTRRPDLFGCNSSGDWAVAEAKGRSRVTTRLVERMREQKSAVAAIDGTPPAYRYGSATRFLRNQLELRIVDPPAKARAQDVPLDPAGWLIDYYRPIVELLAALAVRQQNGLVFATLPGTDLEVGLSEGVIAAVNESPRSAFNRPAPRFVDVNDTRDEDVVADLRMPLIDRARTPEAQVLVEQLTSHVRTADRSQGGWSDGVYVRDVRR